MDADRILKAPAGTVLFEAGDEGGHLFVLNDGHVEISKVHGEVKVVLTILSPGAVFGELSLLLSLPRSATATALDEVTVTAVDSAGLLTRIANDPMFALKLLERLAVRVRALTEALLEMATSTPAELEDRVATIEYVAPGYL